MTGNILLSMDLYFGARKSCGLAIFSLILPDCLGVSMDQRISLGSSALSGRAKTAPLPHSTPTPARRGVCEPLTSYGWFAPAAVFSALSLLKLTRRSDTGAGPCPQWKLVSQNLLFGSEAVVAENDSWSVYYSFSNKSQAGQPDITESPSGQFSSQQV